MSRFRCHARLSTVYFSFPREALESISHIISLCSSDWRALRRCSFLDWSPPPHPCNEDQASFYRHQVQRTATLFLWLMFEWPSSVAADVTVNCGTSVVFTVARVMTGRSADIACIKPYCTTYGTVQDTAQDMICWKYIQHVQSVILF